jgi:hypothetical protein
MTGRPWNRWPTASKRAKGISLTGPWPLTGSGNHVSLDASDEKF